MKRDRQYWIDRAAFYRRLGKLKRARECELKAKEATTEELRRVLRRAVRLAKNEKRRQEQGKAA